MNSPLRTQPSYWLSSFADQVMGDVASIAGTGSIDRSKYPYYYMDCVTYDTQVPPVIPAMRWKPGDAHFERVKETGGPAPNAVTGTIGSWMMTFHVKIYGNSAFEAYNELNAYLMPALERQFSLPPIGHHELHWSECAAENNCKNTIEFSFVAPIAVPTQPYTRASIHSASYAVTNVTGSTYASSGSFRKRTIT